jgi:hypothetical protein
VSEDNHNGLSSQDVMLLWWAYDLYFGKPKDDKTPAKGQQVEAGDMAPGECPPKAQPPVVTPPEGGPNR